MKTLKRRIFLKLRYLKQFFRVCAWCRRINIEGNWISLEEFFEQDPNIKVSHGICPECSEKLKIELKTLRREDVRVLEV
jgi:hypothetical protein